MANETILVVDGDTRSRKVLEVSFKKSGYRVSITKSIDEALAALQTDTPDLIVSDTDLPDGDGFNFCKQVKSRPEFEHIPFLFLTEEAALPRKIEGLEIGADDYLTRPIYIKEVTTRIEALLQKRDRERLSEGGLDEEFTGQLAEITLIDLLQTIDEEERTGRVDFEREDRRGTLTFREGRIIDARCGKLQGEAAVYRLMLWPAGTFVVTYQEEVRGAAHIDRSTEELLLEGINRLQQWDRLIDDVPPLDRVFETDYRELPELLDNVPEEVGRIVRLFDGFRTLREVIDDSPVDDVTSLRIIRRIFEEGVLEDVTTEAGRESTSQSRSHLADWLEAGEGSLEEDSGFDENEEDTSPGYPGGGPEPAEEVETGEMSHHDLATALSQELEEGRDEENLAESTDSGMTSGRRYMPASDSGVDKEESGRIGGDGAVLEDPASVDETLEELEEAERMRRQEEAKRLVEQQQEITAVDHQPVEEVDPDDTAQEIDADELRRVEEQGVPRIPGATRTRRNQPGIDESDDESLAETVEVDSAERESVDPDANDASPRPGEPASGEWETGVDEEEESDEAPARKREATPRARPTADSPATTDADTASSSNDAEPVAEDVPADRESAGVPVSFQSVEESSDVEEPEEEETAEGAEEPDEASTSAERRAVSVDEAESVQDEASAAVRESARKALEEAAAAVEPEGSAEAAESDEEPSPPDNAIPFGSPTDSQLAPGGRSPFEAQEDVPPEEIPESLENVERISNNGEVVRAEYDLSEERPPDDEAFDKGSSRARTPEAGGGAGGEGDDLDRGLAWDDEPTARKIEPSTAEPEPAESDEELAPVADGGTAQADSSSDVIEEASSSPTDEWPGATIGRPPADESGDDEETEAETTDTPQEGLDEAEAAGESAEETTLSGVGRSPASQTDEGFGTDIADRVDDETAVEEAETAPGTESEERDEEPPEAEDAEEEQEASDEQEEAGEESVEVGALSDSSNEVSFFEEGAQQEEGEEYDWEFDEEVDEGGGALKYVVAVVLLGAVAVGGAFAAQIGPFATSTSTEDDGASSGGNEAVASSETPTDDDETQSSAAPETSETSEPEPTKSPEVKETESTAEETAYTVGDRALTMALSTPSDGDESTEQTSSAGDAQQTTAQAGQSSQGSSASGGASLGGEIARVRQMINSKRYSDARSKIDALKQRAPNNGNVASLYLDLASGLQIDGRLGAAKRAYRDYLDMKPSGSRADEVRSILNRL